MGELARILNSRDFKASQRSKDILHFVVQETLAGRDHTLKGYTLATQVLGRGSDFNGALDPIVRIEAGKLRRALERYYLTTPSAGSIRIDIPKGTYVPTFVTSRQGKSIRVKDRNVDLPETPRDYGPAILIRPFENPTKDPEINHFAVGLARELAIGLNQYRDIRVLSYRPDAEQHVSDHISRFMLSGSVRPVSSRLKFTVTLDDCRTGEQIWGNTYESALDTQQLVIFQEEVVRTVAACIAGERGLINQTLTPESKSKPFDKLSVYEAILRYHEFDIFVTPETFGRAFEALQHAVNLAPDNGQVWAMLGRLYFDAYALDSFRTGPEHREQGLAFAEKSILLAPECQRCHAILAFGRLLSNEIEAGLSEVDTALALNPDSLFYMDSIGYLATLLGDWQRGPALIRQAIRSNPYYRASVHYALWVDWVRQEDYEQAHLETLKFRRSHIFWNPLMRAASLGLLGRGEQGKPEVERLLQLKPDFKTQGHTLIRHYMKFEDTVERLVEGLALSGLVLE